MGLLEIKDKWSSTASQTCSVQRTQSFLQLDRCQCANLRLAGRESSCCRSRISYRSESSRCFVSVSGGALKGSPQARFRNKGKTACEERCVGRGRYVHFQRYFCSPRTRLVCSRWGAKLAPYRYHASGSGRSSYWHS